ncbi:MAG: four helix bundle protein [Candidatus Uhrbacteria bacterium]
MELRDLEVYQIARDISREAWVIYEQMDWQERKIIGNQWITSIDSIGANVAEGFGRYHYLDKNRFNYNARGSLLEAIHWIELLKERNKISNRELESLKPKIELLHFKLNNYINSTKKQLIKP